MGKYVIAYDLGTGGNKASLYDVDGNCLAETFVPYPTRYPAAGWHEQRPMDWWQAVVKSTNELMTQANIDKNEIEGLGISGQSLAVVPLDKNGNLLRESIPIWSDSRATIQAKTFFKKIAEPEWYLMTGNGFPAPLYAIFKIMWYRDHEPKMFNQIHKIIGSKDFINFILTGRIVTDYSYASGSGIYDLKGWKYSDKLIEASGIRGELLPDMVPSSEIIGTITSEAAKVLGLPTKIKVVAGGVDNSCMALGARNIEEGRVYNSLGSSSWIAVSSEKPLLNQRARPYVFTHVIPGLFTSAVSIFSAGSSFRWIRDQLCNNLLLEAEERKMDSYDFMTMLAAEVPIGARKLLFNPSLAGGTSLDDNPNIRGAFIGLDLGHTQADIIRATIEGITLNLRLALNELRKLAKISDEMLIVGGGSSSKFWRQVCADVYNVNIVKTNINQQAAALGAAALAAVGTGLWHGFEKIDEIHRIEEIASPIATNNKIYEKLLPIFARAAKYQAELGDMLAKLEI
jgi:xylulokinase